MLPTIAVPQYSVQLVSRKEPVRYRPYVVGEEKLLMMAMTGEDPKEVEESVRQLITACTFNAIDVRTLPSFDLEYLFLMLRAKSVNNVVDINYRCLQTTGDNQPCNTVVPVKIDLNDVKITVPEGHTNVIWLTDDLGIEMNYPGAIDEEPVELTSILPKCIKSIFTKDGTVHAVSEVPAAEIKSFVENLTIPMVSKINTFFETMPRLSYQFDFKCPVCRYEEQITLSGLMDFFV